MKNPYLDEYKPYTASFIGNQLREGNITTDVIEFGHTPINFGDYVEARRARERMVHQYSFSIPTDGAVTRIAALAPIVEIGAGSGYWAWMLRQAGAQVEAFDIDPPAKTWTEVRQGTHDVLPGYSGYTLMLSWPPYATPMGVECLRAYEGDRLVYVGEVNGGCCADDAFFDELEVNWGLISSHGLPTWEGMHDYMSVYERNT